MVTARAGSMKRVGVRRHASYRGTTPSQGAKRPALARRHATVVARIRLLLPAMFGAVSTQMPRQDSALDTACGGARG